MADLDLDSMLKEALDEFVEDAPTGATDLDDAAHRAASVSAARASTPTIASPESKASADPASLLENMLRDIGSEEFQRQLASVMNDAALGGAGSSVGERQTTGEGASSDEQLLRMLERLSAEVPKGVGAPAVGGAEMSEADLRSMSEELERLGGSGGLPTNIDGMMQQLVSRDIMYEPMSAIVERLPTWLIEHGPRLSSSERERYDAQLTAFRRVLAHYDAEPGNFPRLMELLADLQNYGQPPPDLVRELTAAASLDSGPPAPGSGPSLPECSLM